MAHNLQLPLPEPQNIILGTYRASTLIPLSGEYDDNLNPWGRVSTYGFLEIGTRSGRVNLSLIKLDCQLPFIQNCNGAGNARTPPDALVHTLYERQESRVVNFLCRKVPEVIFEGTSPTPHLITKHPLAKTGNSDTSE